MKTSGSYLYKGKKCPKCGAPDLHARIDADRLLVELSCQKCFARSSRTITREDALKAIAERDAQIAAQKA